LLGEAGQYPAFTVGGLVELRSSQRPSGQEVEDVTVDSGSGGFHEIEGG
jgi:hypothetical protein